jgi:flap endonuclease-1
MGVQLSGILPVKEVELVELSGRKIAIDAYNTIYQFLSIIRDRMTGELLKDSRGGVTSHLSGLLYRTSNLIEVGIKPVFVFDGEPPAFKKKTVEARKNAREEATRKWKEAVERGEEAITFAQATSKLTDEMVVSAKKLLDIMGVPWVQAKSEGEMQCAHMCKKGDVWASASQDYDSILAGSPKLIRNLSISGRRKVPKKDEYMEIKPEIIEMDKVLQELGITKEQLIIVGILTGTDYAEGVTGVGPKTALKLVGKHKTLREVLKNVEWTDEVPAEDIYEFFLNSPAVNKYDLDWKQVDAEKLLKFMVDEHDFSRERVEKVIERLQQSFASGRQASLKGWFEK